MLNGIRLPFYTDIAVLRAMSVEALREHAKKLHLHLGPSKIGRPLPYSYEELVDYIMHVQRAHLAPLRGLAGSLERAELKAERDFVRAELGYPYYPKKRPDPKAEMDLAKAELAGAQLKVERSLARSEARYPPRPLGTVAPMHRLGLRANIPGDPLFR